MRRPATQRLPGPGRQEQRDYDRTRAHHRIEIRRLKAAAFDHLDYLDAKQALQVVRWRMNRGTGELTTALVQLAPDLPPAILAPMLGLHPITAQQWRRRAATDWTAYLEARSTSRAPGDDTTGP
nr:hypothetical protein OG409_37000 [Streptomyces sp. NBC_00974]